MRLRPTGKSGSLVCPLNEFQRYYEGGGAQLWERQALTRARVVFGDSDFARLVSSIIEQGAYHVDWKPALIGEIREMRARVEESGSERDLKRGAGGIIDIEFLVQMLRLKYGRRFPALRSANTWATLDALRDTGLLPAAEHDTLRSCFDFLRLVESRLRIVHNRSLDELPQRPEDLEKLARRLGCEPALGGSAGERFLHLLEQHTTRTRELFLRILERERTSPC
jgi:glutamate-ammonia-ligase adenylyltransferase